jgi:4-alpha-glucanotransferase
LNLYPTADIQNEVVQERERDKVNLLNALREQGLQPSYPAVPSDPFTPELARALHVYLSRSPTVLVALQIEDLLGMVDPVNVPGTDREYPNWQRKISSNVEDMVERIDFDETFSAVAHARG